MINCPNPGCPVSDKCMKFDGDPPLCWRPQGEPFDPSDPELRQLLSGPGHPAQEEFIPDAGIED